MRRTMTPAEHGEHQKRLLQKEFLRLEAIGTKIADRQEQIKALSHSPGGEFLVELWEDQLRDARISLETCDAASLQALQYEVAIYRRWIAMLTQPIETREEQTDA